jgi:hypothetical protein
VERKSGGTTERTMPYKFASHIAIFSKGTTISEMNDSLFKLNLDIMEKFAYLDHINRDMFRQLVASRGAEMILAGQNDGIDFFSSQQYHQSINWASIAFFTTS